MAAELRGSLPSAAPTGIGSLPHRDPVKAAAFTLANLPEVPAVPSLPRRSPAEGMIAQAAVGIPGITIGQYGNLAVDPGRADPHQPVCTDLDHGGYDGLKAFLVAADPATTPVVKWQIVGPVTLGLTLLRAGVRSRAAFDVATRAVEAHIAAIHERIATALPGATQLVFLDEPMLTDLQSAEFPLAPGRAIDYVSGVLAHIESFGVSGVHCCGQGDWASILASGPSVLSVPAESALVDVAGYLSEFLDNGGWVAWGVVPTDRPIPTSVERPWRDVRSLWCSLVKAGCDPERLLHQALVTPACGLFNHAEGVASRVFKLLRDMSERMRDEATARRLSAGVP